MVIDIRGTDFVNKGAHLMLLAALKQVRQRLPAACVAMQAFASGCPYERRAEVGVLQLVSIGRLPRLSNFVSRTVPGFVRSQLGVVLERDVNVVLDARGFAYTDQRGPIPARRTAKAIVRWKRNATRVILLPQAFGPFKTREIQRNFQVIAKRADLIYARDKRSHDYITNLVGERDNVRRAPDFTNLLAGKKPASSESYTDRVCIVPNQRMLDKTPISVGTAYVRLMARCALLLKQMGRFPFILMHEGPQDRRLAETIMEESGFRMSVIDDLDPLRIKGIIGACHGMIGSRYHALVSALSQSRPALAVGWSHKYNGLFEDYGVPEGMLTVDEDDNQLRRKIRMICEGTEREGLIRRIAENSEIEQNRTRRMWDDVFSLCNRSGLGSGVGS